MAISEDTSKGRAPATEGTREPTLRTFHLAVSEAALDDLRERLGRVRWPDTLSGCGWTMGTDHDYLHALVEHWRRDFDWRAQERALNAFPQYIMRIDGIDVHFVQVRGSGARRIPLLITHGWPATFVELLKLVPLLTRGGLDGEPDVSFDLILPSIPGFGFSSRPSAPGMNNFRVARLWVRLMERLGYPRFGLQGGDVGAGVGTALALQDPDRVIGLHLNYIPGSYQPYVPPHGELAEEERQYLAEVDQWFAEEGAYMHQQRTKPQTLAFGLNDSPAGLAAWIVEKYRGWSDCQGDIARRFNPDEVLLQVMIYWITETIHSSMRYYYENRLVPFRFTPDQRVDVPCAVARFPREIQSPPRRYVERGYRIVRWTHMPRGGHFAAHEEPELLADDVRAFFSELAR